METGYCPNCRKQGPVWTMCNNQKYLCAESGYHYIAQEYFEEADKADTLVGKSAEGYLIVDRLGVGGFGQVHLALDHSSLVHHVEVKVALKTLHSHVMESDNVEKILQNFQREAAVLASLVHPNIIRLIKYGIWKQTPFLVMELVENGRTLREEIVDKAANEETLSPSVTRHIMRQTLSALDTVHQRNIIHRDIKPENIMLQRVSGDDYLVKVLDFGLVKLIGEATHTSKTAGTWEYLAPEQLRCKGLGPETDLYALGVVLFELLTGETPFLGCSFEEIGSKKRDPKYDPTEGLVQLNFPQPIIRFLRRAMAHSTRDRFRNVGQFQSAMNRVFELVEEMGSLSTLNVAVSELVEENKLQQQTERINEENRRIEEVRRQLEERKRELEKQEEELPVLKKQRPEDVSTDITSIPTSMEHVRGENRRGDVIRYAGSPSPSVYIKLLVIGLIALSGSGGVIIWLLLHPEKQESGDLKITSDPTGAAVEIDDQILDDETPTIYRLSPGKHRIRFKMPGYHVETTTVKVLPNQQTVVNAELRMIPGKLRVETTPSGASVIFKGETIGKTPLESEFGRQVPFSLTLRLEGYQEEQIRVDFSKDAALTFRKRLTSLPKPKKEKPKNKMSRRKWD